MSYAFTHTELARQRLAVLADVYARSTSDFLRACVTQVPNLVIDLGCGPGHTTRLLAEVLQAEQAIGLDISPDFIAFAQQNATPRVSFLTHDITSVPFPVGPADLLYCRFLLTHLQHPQTVLARWATQLRPGQLLLIEEVEWIHTQHELFSRYLTIIEAMLAG
jgi:trans-aconitate methyltransferase